MKKSLFILIAGLGLSLGSVNSLKAQSHKGKDALIGGVGGAVVGGAVGHGKGAVIGGVAGAGAGYAYGAHRDKTHPRPKRKVYKHKD